MALYNKNGKPELYDLDDLFKIITVVSRIHYSRGVIHTLIPRDKSEVSENTLLRNHAENTLNLIEKYNKTAPETLKNMHHFNDLEKTCKRILESK